MVRPKQQGKNKHIAGLPCYKYDPATLSEKLKELSPQTDFITFDIETTTVDEHTNFMYVWMVCVANKFTM